MYIIADPRKGSEGMKFWLFSSSPLLPAAKQRSTSERIIEVEGDLNENAVPPMFMLQRVVRQVPDEEIAAEAARVARRILEDPLGTDRDDREQDLRSSAVTLLGLSERLALLEEAKLLLKEGKRGAGVAFAFFREHLSAPRVPAAQRPGPSGKGVHFSD